MTFRKKILGYIFIAIGSLLISSHSSKACQGDNKNYVRGNDLCLAIETYKGSKVGNDTTVVVTLHGDVSSGGPADYLNRALERFIVLLPNQNVVGIAMWECPAYC